MSWCRALGALLVIAAVGKAQYHNGGWPSPPSCVTPLQEPGRCVTIEQCVPIKNLLSRGTNALSSEARLFLQRSQCGQISSRRRPNVCCASHGKTIVFIAPPVTAALPGNGQPRPDAIQPGARQTEATRQAGRTPIVAPPVRGNGGGPRSAALLLADDECGFPNVDTVGVRIIDGFEVELGEYPWMALVQYKSVRSGALTYGCGGVLINKRYVLTAAHCSSIGPGPAKFNRKVSAVRLGEHDKSTNEDCLDARTCSDPVVDVAVETEVVHPEYKPSDLNSHNDIALFRLARDVTFSKFIKPICLPHLENMRSNNYITKNLSVAGWGKTENEARTQIGNSNVLKKTSFPILPTAECAKQWIGQAIKGNRRVVKTDSQICTKGVPGRDACTGDSGGPLMSLEKVARDGTQRYHVVGIVSYGAECKWTDPGVQTLPGVYTRVAFFVDWILGQIKQ